MEAALIIIQILCLRVPGPRLLSPQWPGPGPEGQDPDCFLLAVTTLWFLLLEAIRAPLGHSQKCWLFPQEGKEFAESRGLLFMETSARLNHQVSEIFSAVGE